MKTYIISRNRLKSIDLFEAINEDELMVMMDEYSLMESHVVYFSAGESRIKEILIQKEPYFSF